MKRVLVYVASPDWEINIYTSIHSLVESGNKFDLVKIYSVGGDMKSIKKIDMRVEVKVVKNINKKYFAHNKMYLTRQKGDRVVYMDADTISLGKIKKIYKNSSKKVIARVDTCSRIIDYINGMKESSKNKWKNFLTKNLLMSNLYNSGFLIFKDNSQNEIKKKWKKLIKKDKKIWREESENINTKRRITEQMTFSIAAEDKIGCIKKMNKKHHVYGWEVGPREVGSDTIIYHTGSRGGKHLKYASAIAKGRNLSFNVPLISSATHPLFLKLQRYDLGYRAKHFFTGVGD